MPTDFLDTAIGAARLSLLFTVALFLPVLLQLSLLLAAGWALNGLAGFSGFVQSLLGLVGAPLHELFHATASLVTFCGVNAIKLLSDSASVAFVEPRRSHFLQRILVGLAPLLGGIFVLWLTATYVLPGFEAAAVPLPELDLITAASLDTLLRESLDYLGLFSELALGNLSTLQWDSWRTYVGLYIALSVGAGIMLSQRDRQYLVRGLPAALILTWIVFAVLYLSGDAESRFLVLQEWFLPHLVNLTTVATSAFFLSIIGIIILLPLALWRRLRPW
jgi:hypothetical protein